MTSDKHIQILHEVIKCKHTFLILSATIFKNNIFDDLKNEVFLNMRMCCRVFLYSKYKEWRNERFDPGRELS